MKLETYNNNDIMCKMTGRFSIMKILYSNDIQT